MSLPTAQKFDTNLGPISVWVYGGTNAGTLNNREAIALALSPHNIRQVKHMSLVNNELVVDFIDPVNKEIIQETIKDPQKLPSVFIGSTTSFPETSQIHHLFSTFMRGKKGSTPLPFIVNMIIPDIQFTPSDPSIDMTIAFRHQMGEGHLLARSMHSVHVYDTVPSRISQSALELGRQTWHHELSGFEETRPVYFIVMGARLDENKDISIEDTKLLAKHIQNAIKKTGGSVVLTTSKRNKWNKEEIAVFTAELDPKTLCYFYDYNENKGKNNPYAGLLSLADKIVVTGDSMSMISDCIATGKPTYVFDRSDDQPVEHWVTGHKAYVDNLIKLKLLLPIDVLEYTPPYDLYPVNSAGQIASDIREQLLSRNKTRSL